MADDVVVDNGALTDFTVAADEAPGGKLLQLIKLVYSADGDRTHIGADVNGLDVDVTRLPALPAGTNNIGDVDVVTLPALPAGTNNIGDVDIVTLPALPAGTNNIGDVDVITVVPGTGATQLGKAEDAVHTSGDTGVMALAVRNDTPAALAATSGDYLPLTTSSDGSLWVRLNGIPTVDIASGMFSLITHTTSNFEVLPSAARTATPTIADRVNEYHVGVVVVINVTAVTSTPSVVPTFRMKEEQTSDTYLDVLVGTAIATTGTYRYYIGPEAPTAAVYTGSVITRLWRTWHMTLVHGNANSITYSVAGTGLLG